MSTARATLAVRCAPPGRMHHLLADALPAGYRLRGHGPDGVHAQSTERSIIVSRATYDDGVEWCHASMITSAGQPTYDELCWLHRIVYGEGFAYQCFVPPSSHVNIHADALHLWGRVDGLAALPDFGRYGTI